MDPVIRIRSEQPFLYQPLEVRIGRADEPEIDCNAALCADPHHLFFLDRTQHPHLHGWQHLANLVEQ